jgi:hypothetical protein
MSGIGASYYDGYESWHSVEALLGHGLDKLSYKELSDNALQQIYDYTGKIAVQQGSYNSYAWGAVVVGSSISEVSRVSNSGIFGVVGNIGGGVLAAFGNILESSTYGSRQEAMSFNSLAFDELQSRRDRGWIDSSPLDRNAAHINYNGDPRDDAWGNCMFGVRGCRIGNPFTNYWAKSASQVTPSLP